jgi:hypothetical protein
MKLTVLIGLIVVAATLLDYTIIRFLMSRCWGHLPRAFPRRPPREDAVRRNFQSFQLGLCNFGFCIHVAVDEQYLHLEPARLIRLLGAGPASIPWESIRLTGPPRRGWLTAQVGDRQFLGPAWCLELAGS